ncbi:hypothetical protein F4809DRAFT_47264 [Biscogniauxia mediterranea]|nr:hypothetical protein F4809DRAFT_47264 [Biscogniauxia mediterranea]
MTPTASCNPPIIHNRECRYQKHSRLRKNVPGKEFTNMYGGNNWQYGNALDLGLRPRLFEAIDSERIYHNDRLQKQDSHTLDLFRQFAQVENQIRHGCVNGRKKAAKKHRNWLKQKIGESIREEKLILSRLGELHVEIQCRERWCQIRGDREFRDTRYHPTGYGESLPPPAPLPHPPSLIPYPHSSHTYPVEVHLPTSAPVGYWLVYPQSAISFGPAGFGGGNETWQHANHLSAPISIHSDCPSLQSPTQVQASPTGYTAPKDVLEAERKLGRVQLDDAPHRHAGMEINAVGRKGKRGRTQSLPSLRFRWAEEEGKDEDAHICLGYDSREVGIGHTR